MKKLLMLTMIFTGLIFLIGCSTAGTKTEDSTTTTTTTSTTTTTTITDISYVGDDGSGGHGSVTVSGILTANEGQTVTLKVTPSGTSGLYHTRLTYIPKSGGTATVINPTTDGTYSFVMPAYKVTVNAVITNIYQIGDMGPSGWGKVVRSNSGGVTGLEVVNEYWNGADQYPCFKNYEGTFTNALNTLNQPLGNGGTATDWRDPTDAEIRVVFSMQSAIGVSFIATYWRARDNSTGALIDLHHNGSGSVDYYGTVGTRGGQTTDFVWLTSCPVHTF